MATTTEGPAEPRELTEQDELACFDRAARRLLGTSGEECIAAWKRGAFDDDPDRPDVMALAMLIPFGR